MPTVTADSSGNYTISGLANGLHTITPTKAGYTFTPSSTQITISNANATNVNFSATATGGAGGYVVADSSGNYTINGLAAGSHTVTPTKAGYTFAPPSTTIASLSSNQVGVNFTATAGQVVTADASGNFEFDGLADGTYNISVAEAGSSFWPGSRQVTVQDATVTGINFFMAFTISGNVGQAGVLVTYRGLQGMAQGSAISDSSGNFTLAGLPNDIYLITPSTPGWSFTPPRSSVTVSGANVSGVGFTPQLPVYGLNGNVVYPLAMPSTPSPRKITMGANNLASASISPFTGTTQIVQWSGEWWEAEVALPDMPVSQAELWISFLVALRGIVGTFLMGDPARKTPLGPALGTPLVAGTYAAGTTCILTSGWAANQAQPLFAGDYIQLGQRLHKVLLSTPTGLGGQSYLLIFPAIRAEGVTSGQAIITQNPVGTFRLSGNWRQWQTDFSRMRTLSFKAVEAISAGKYRRHAITRDAGTPQPRDFAQRMPTRHAHTQKSMTASAPAAWCGKCISLKPGNTSAETSSRVTARYARPATQPERAKLTT